MSVKASLMRNAQEAILGAFDGVDIVTAAQRHFVARQALASGCDAIGVSKLLGLASPRMTLEVYGHVVAGAHERAVASIEQALGAAEARVAQAEK